MWAIAVLVGALALGVGACSTASEETKPPSSHSLPDGPKEEGDPNPGQRYAHNDPSIPVEDGRKDLKVKDIGIRGPDSLPVIDVMVTNSTDKTRTYEYEIEVMAKDDGKRIDVQYGSTDSVRPGQTVDIGNGDMGEDPTGSRLDPIKPEPVTYSILYVDRYNPQT